MPLNPQESPVGNAAGPVSLDSCEQSMMGSDEVTDSLNHGPEAGDTIAFWGGDRPLHALFEAAMDAMVIADDQGCYVAANQAACALFGMTRENLLGQCIADFTPPGFNLEEAWQGFQQQGQERGEFSLVRGDGTVREVEYAATANVMPHRHLSVLRDVTERNQLERQLQRLNQELEQQVAQRTAELQRANTELQAVNQQLQTSQQKYQTLFEILPIGVSITDAEGYLIEANPASETIVGVSPEKHVQRTWNEPVWQMIRADGSPMPAEEYPVVRALRENRPILEVEQGIMRPDGGVRWITTSAAPIPLESYGAAIAYIDITDRKQAEQELETTRNFLQQVLDQLPVAVFAKDARTLQYSLWNNACTRLLGYHPQEVLGKTDTDLFPAEQSQNCMMQDRQAIQSRSIVEIPEEAIVGKDGTCHIIHNRKVAVYGSDGQPHLVIGIVEDITDLKRAQDTLLHQSEREHSLRLITQHIRKTLDLDDILATAVTQVQRILQADRTLILRLNSDGVGTVIQETVRPDYSVTLDLHWNDQCFSSNCYTAYCQGVARIVADITSEPWSLCWREFMQQSAVKSQIVAPITQSQEDGTVSLWGFLIVQACGEQRLWHPEQADLLQQVADQLAIAIQQSQLLEQTAMQTRQEQLLNQIVSAVRSSLDLDQILKQTTEALLQAFQSSRSLAALCDQIDPYFTCTRIATVPNIPSMEGQPIPIVGNPHAQLILSQEAPAVVPDVTLEPTLAAALPLAEQLEIRSMLSVSIRHHQVSLGMLCIQQCDRLRHWTADEQHLLKRVADQLAIAIQQSKLHQQIHQWADTLEQQVQERTGEIQQGLDLEATLKRITDRVRDSLNEDQILETVVQELGQVLSLEYCDTAIYNAEKTISTIAYEFSKTPSSAQGLTFAHGKAPHPEVYPQLLRGQICQFCEVTPNHIRSSHQLLTILACPIVDEKSVLGDLWLFKPLRELFNELEVRLVQQVANQCAIALRQSRLYQAAQAQVRELERLNHLKDDFLSTVSHELRTPISSVKMAIQMLEINLQSTALLTDKSQLSSRYFHILKTECQREIQLINDLLDLTHLDAGTEPLNLTSADLRFLIPHITEPFIERTHQHQQQFDLAIPDDLPLFSTDLSYLERIVTELLNNACKYTPAGECIGLSLQSIPSGLRIAISNSGVEISAAERDRIFDKFYRIPNNDPWKHGGTGLGLALVKKLTERLGGTIHVTSGDGQTAFILEFEDLEQG